MPKFVSPEKKQPIVRVINEALFILSSLGIPFDGLTKRRLEKMAMAFLAVCDVKLPKEWDKVKDTTSGRALTTRQIIEYINQHFEERISRGSYDDIRRKDLKLPVAAGIIFRSANAPGAATNNPTRAYALNPQYTGAVSSFGTENWEEDIEEFMNERETLAERLSKTRDIEHIPVVLPSGVKLQFSKGKHNELQKAIIEEFLPRYGEGCEVLYVGDAADKFLHVATEKLKALNFFEIAHDELPDVVAYSSEKNWLYLIEAVHSSGPISSVRHEELIQLTVSCTAEIVYVTAFLDRSTFRKFAPDIAWETEVWIAESPDHIIHFDGKRFLGPYPRNQ
ncbi:MAG: restriction endonuclease [Deltaproteobacteria bacterium]|nr:restriction endonuclease [Deltaproteobacteria bacterium]MBN2845297.1 restriction endonuclease [Deltaproteobacteria bacterium]